MARPGVTYIDVARAATQLTAQQIRPSIEAVRRILGTGSNSTINRHLREWIKTQGVQTELEQGLPDSLLVAIRGIYDSMREEATTQLTKMTAEKEATISDLKIGIAALEMKQARSKQEKISLQTIINQAKEECAALQRQREHSKKEYDKQAADNHLLMERLGDKQSEIKQLNQLLGHTQSNLDHYRETMHQERLSDRQSFEEKIATLEHQRQMQQALTAEAREEIAQLKQLLESLKSNQKAVEQARIEVLENSHRYERELQSSKLELTQLQQVYDRQLEAYGKLTVIAQADKITISELTIKTEKQNERIALQEAALRKAEDSLRDLADKHLFLTQEKTKVAFQLEKMLATS